MAKTKKTPAAAAKTTSPTTTSLRVDPMLKLYSGCPLIVSDNIHVRAGVANGAQATFQSLVLKSGNTASRTTVDGCFCIISFSNST
jgi:hypothetical protein